MRADAGDYQSFPVAPRIALPVRLSEAIGGVVSTTATNITLIPLQETDGLGTITGKIDLEDPKGTLVVAGGVTALASSDGSYTLFNVPAGNVTVTAYRQGVNLNSESVTVTTDKTLADVDLSVASKTAAKVSGKVAFVNPGGGTDTSVILVVADTFIENVARGEAPPGLRVANVSGNFAIEGVPDGKYVVLAAFEDDFLVRDPDTCIGGTEIVRVTVAGQNVVLDASFKITGALDVISPDAEEVVTGIPTFTWVDDSSEANYSVQVYDAYGALVWEDPTIASVSGNKNGCELSRTEDLHGVFKMQ